MGEPEGAGDRAADAPEDAAFEALWGRVVEAWDDDRTHNALLEYAVRTQRLPDTAGRYRALKDDPERGAKAQKRLDAIVIAATSLLFAEQTPKKRPRPPWQITATAFLIFAVMLGYLSYAVWTRGR